jgi:hypothetical protein
MEGKQIIQFIITIIIVCIVVFGVWYAIDSSFVENFLSTDEEDEVCEYDPYTIKLKTKITNWVDKRVEKWPTILDCLNTNKKKHLHSLQMCKGNSSYTIDKEKVYLCLKDENDNYYDENTMTHVILHEFAHVLCDEIGHTKLFDKMFQCLLDEAHESTCPYQKEQCGRIYDKNIPFPSNYCGLTENDTYNIE